MGADEEGNQEKVKRITSGLFHEDVTILTLLEALATGVVIVDKNGKILFVNASAERMFGYKSKSIIGQSHDILIPERFRNVHKEFMTNYFQSPQKRPMGIGMDLYGLRSDGSEFPVEISLSFVVTQDDIKIISLISDITLRKQDEAELKNRAEKLAKSNRELAELNKNLESFSYSVSHDLKTPLRVILGFCGILLQDYRGEILDDEGLNYLSRIHYNANKMSNLINDILALSRITRQEMIFQKINLSKIAQTIVSDLRKDNPERNVKVQIKSDLQAMADEKLITIVLSNLLGNSWKFTSNTTYPYIEFGMYNKEGHTVYFVKDNGAGFDMSFSDKLFAPFQRLHTESEFTGTGVGLAIVERIINRHGGKIWAEGEIGKGATFFFTLPEII